jgi:hypothetical protein
MLLDEVPPPRFSTEGSPVNRLRATLPMLAAEDGSPVLLRFVRWAFSLNEGDLLAVSPEAASAGSWRFLSYGGRVWSAADGCLHPWSFVEELLRLPMAAIEPHGVIRLPEEAEELRAGSVLLRAEVDPRERSFTLEPLGDRPIHLEHFLQAQYLLPVLPGFQVMLPADMLWVLNLRPGDPLACKPSLATAEFEAFELEKNPKGRTVVELGPGGLLSLPESLRVPSALTPYAQVRLRVTFASRVTFEVTQWAELE